ncbi:translation initiation factor eIF 4e-like domain-containing protein [Diplogelasinospora grovesii]|uniref:Translation initiation factor eIF 4e-like domain-containing protein n=1 Tax=Diplogelasinospora grovesii TaxID=303347 RepID=A0AAN6NKB8_9PEZI|nr:translation initiation factor eIF 4e-like domain-containing protein [Diplogelasinospora grovesii]
MDNLWSRRTNSSKLSLSTHGSGGGDSSSPGRSTTTFSKRFGGDSSSHGKSNPFNSIPTPAGLVSPTAGASSAFGLGSGAFAAFGSAKTPKSPGNPFESALGSTTKTPSAEKSAKDGGLSSSGDKAIGKPASNASLAESSKTTTGSTSTVSAGPPTHQLRNNWVFWFRPPISKANGFIEYEKTLHPIAACESAEDFFTVYQHLKRPSALPLVSDYHLFKKGIRPIWEDEENKNGGKWIVRLRKGVADRYWEDLLFAIIGDQFGEASEEVCGAVLSVRNGEDILSIWARANGQRVLKIRSSSIKADHICSETMRRILSFPPDTKLEWKSHDSSIQQRTAIEESRREKQNNNHHNNDKRTSNRHNNQQRERTEQTDDQKNSLNT